MKNFSDIMAIDCDNQLEIHTVLKIHGFVDYELSINNIIIKEINSKTYLNLFDEINVICKINEIEDSSALEILNLSINGRHILPVYPYLASNNSCWLNEKMIWYIKIPTPFYTWYHKISGMGMIA